MFLDINLGVDINSNFILLYPNEYALQNPDLISVIVSEGCKKLVAMSSNEWSAVPVDILDLYILLSVVDINICLSSDISDADLRNFLGDGLVGERFDDNMFKYCSCDIAVLLLYSLLQRNESVVIC
eukprot:151048_1